MNIKIFEKEFPMAYTVAAQSEIAKRFGGIENIEVAFDDKNVAGTMENAVFIAACMVKAAVDRECVQCKVMGKPAPEYIQLSAEEIAAAIDPAEVKKLMPAIMETIKEGNQITVEVEPQKGKNAEAMP